MKRIGIIMYDKFIFIRLNVYLLFVEVVLMLVIDVGVYEVVYFVIFWFCYGKYFNCIKVF